MTISPTPASQSRRGLWAAVAGCVVLALCLCVVGGAGAGYLWFNQRAPSGDQPAVEYILDASPRMALPAAGAEGNATRLAIAQGVLAEIVRPADPTVAAGLRVFGTGALPQACQDTDLLVPLAPANQAAISDRALALSAGAAADAALAEAMIAAIRDVAAQAGPHTLVVVTGGSDSCNPEAGQLIANEAERAGIDLRMFVVGYQVPPEDVDAIKGTVEAGGGTYLDALTEEELRAILDAIQNYVDDDTPALLDQVLVLATPAALATAVAAAPSPTPAPAGATSTPGAPTATSAVPTAEPTAAAGYQSQTACDHPYLPLRLGATWNYSGEFGGYTWTVTEVSGDQQNATATLVMAMPDLTLTYHWTCTPEGIVSYDYGNVGLSSGGENMTFEVLSSEGVWLLPADRLTPGTAWTYAYSIRYAADEVSSTARNSESMAVTSREPVSGAGETFDSVRIDGSSTMTVSSMGAGEFTFDNAFTYWLGYGVGIVSSTSTGGGETSSITLVSYSIP